MVVEVVEVVAIGIGGATVDGSEDVASVEVVAAGWPEQAARRTSAINNPANRLIPNTIDPDGPHREGPPPASAGYPHPHEPAQRSAGAHERLACRVDSLPGFALGEMIIDDAHSLHEGVGGCRTDEAEPALLQVLR